MREQLARRSARKCIKGAPAVKQFGGKLASQWLVERQAPLVAEPDGHHGGHALGDARRAEGVIRPERTARPPGQGPRRRAAPAAITGKPIRQPADYTHAPAPLV